MNRPHGRPEGYTTQGQRFVRLLFDLAHAWPKPLTLDALSEKHGVSPRTILRDLHALEEMRQAMREGSGWVWALGASTLQGAESLFLRPLPAEERAALVGIAFGFKPRRQLRRAAGC